MGCYNTHAFDFFFLVFVLSTKVDLLFYAARGMHAFCCVAKRVTRRTFCTWKGRCFFPWSAAPASIAGSRKQIFDSSSFGGQTATYVFHSGAYGIPKTRPPVPSKQSASRGFLGPLADFFMGGQKRSETPTSPNQVPALPSSLASLHGSGLQSAIRSDGRIVKTRLQSRNVGQDAYFLKNDAMGVADGVGGWAAQPHADPSLFSRLLMHFFYAELQQLDETLCRSLDGLQDMDDVLSEWFICNPVDMLQTAWERCVRASKREGILGSSTALAAILRGDELRIANMGDCVLFLIRDGELIFRSAEQQHSFNCPLQLGMMDATVESVTLSRAMCMHRSGMIPAGAHDIDLPDVNESMSDYINTYDRIPSQGDLQYDTPQHDAGHWELKVQPGDLVLIASDGLFDNLFDDEIMETVHDVFSQFPRSDLETMQMYAPALLSERLCHMARTVMDDPRVISSPFQQHATEEGMYYVGGKSDDVTVLAGLISEQQRPCTL